MGIRREEEMEMSDDDSGDNPSKKLRVDDSGKYMKCCFIKSKQKLTYEKWHVNTRLYKRVSYFKLS